jgi:hypothetical protein
VEERDNKYRIDERLLQSKQMKQAIPFLRTNDDEYKQIVYKKPPGLRAHLRSQS